MPDAGWILARVRPLLGLESSSAPQEENFVAWQRFVETDGRARAAALVFDDMHWAKPGSLAFLEHLASHLADVPALVIVVARPELRDEHLDVTEGGHWVDIDLHPLSAAETRRLVGFLAGATAARSRRRSPSAAAATPSSPRSSFDCCGSGRVTARLDGAYWEAAETALPDSLAALVAARLDALDPELKDVLTDAAVVGQTFWPGALVGCGRDRAGERRWAPRGAGHREFVRRMPDSSLAGEVEYTFWHGLTREVAYAALPRGVRAGKHAAVAQWIESGEQKAAAAEVLAHHYETSAGAGGGGRRRRARRPPHRADCARVVGGGRQGVAAGRGRGRASLPARVASVPGRKPARACPAGRLRGVSAPAGDLAEARSVLERGLLGLRVAGEVRAEAVATDRLASLLWLQGDAKAIEVAASAAALLEREPPSAEQVKVMADWAAMCAASYESERAILLADRALDLCRELRLPVSVRALGWRGLARCHFGDAGGLDDMRRALSLAKRQALERYAGMLYTNLGDEVFGVPRSQGRVAPAA